MRPSPRPLQHTHTHPRTLILPSPPTLAPAPSANTFSGLELYERRVFCFCRPFPDHNFFPIPRTAPKCGFVMSFFLPSLSLPPCPSSLPPVERPHSQLYSCAPTPATLPCFSLTNCSCEKVMAPTWECRSIARTNRDSQHRPLHIQRSFFKRFDLPEHLEKPLTFIWWAVFYKLVIGTVDVRKPSLQCENGSVRKPRSNWSLLPTETTLHSLRCAARSRSRLRSQSLLQCRLRLHISFYEPVSVSVVFRYDLRSRCRAPLGCGAAHGIKETDLQKVGAVS